MLFSEIVLHYSFLPCSGKYGFFKKTIKIKANKKEKSQERKLGITLFSDLFYLFYFIFIISF